MIRFTTPSPFGLAYPTPIKTTSRTCHVVAAAYNVKQKKFEVAASSFLSKQVK